MPASRSISITLPDAEADAVSALVRSGRYRSESDVVRDGLRALDERERAVEGWLSGSVATEYAAWERGSLESVDLSEFRDELARERATRT